MSKSRVPDVKCLNAKSSSIWDFYLYVSIMYIVRDVKVVKISLEICKIYNL